MVLVYNHDLERKEIQAEDITLQLDGQIEAMKKAVIDETHCNPLAAWEAMGSPAYLKKEQEQKLREASELVWEEIVVDPAAKLTEVSLTALPESVTAYKITLV